MTLTGMNWQIINTLIVEEIKRVNEAAPGSGYQGMRPEYRQAMLDELTRMNKIALDLAEKQQ